MKLAVNPRLVFLMIALLLGVSMVGWAQVPAAPVRVRNSGRSAHRGYW